MIRQDYTRRDFQNDLLEMFVYPIFIGDIKEFVHNIRNAKDGLHQRMADRSGISRALNPEYFYEEPKPDVMKRLVYQMGVAEFCRLNNVPCERTEDGHLSLATQDAIYGLLTEDRLEEPRWGVIPLPNLVSLYEQSKASRDPLSSLSQLQQF